MQRRNFIEKTLKSLPLLSLSPTLLQACARNNENQNSGKKSVIVIGAGISGLAAAKKLKEKGFSVRVLEAQNMVGGRLRTNRSLGVAFDEGASWIHGINGNPITSLAQEAGMTTFHTDDDSIVAYNVGGTAIRDTVFNNAETQFYNVLETMMDRGDTSKSFETVFNSLYPSRTNDPLWKFFLSTYLTFDTGDLDKLSSTLYEEGEEFGGIEKIATNGFDTIPKYLATGLDISFSQRVTKVDYTGEKVRITHNNNQSEADYVLVTVPLGVLKANRIEFLPALPAQKQTAIQKLGMNCVNKFLLTWNNVFWDDEQYIAYTPNTRDKFNYFVNVNKINPNVKALMTFAYADYGRQTETMSDNQIIDEIMTHLKDIYGNNIPTPNALLRTRWNSNENSFGSYSFTAVGTEMRHFNDLAATVNNKLFFAGEHTHIDYFSTVHGAYLSGLREADKIIAL